MLAALVFSPILPIKKPLVDAWGGGPHRTKGKPDTHQRVLYYSVISVATTVIFHYYTILFLNVKDFIGIKNPSPFCQRRAGEGMAL